MSTETMVLYGSVLIPTFWVTAFFWLADRKAAREARAPGDVQEAAVLVNGGYHPERVTVRAGRPIRLQFTRTEDGESWWDDVEFPYRRVLRELPEGESVTVDLGPLGTGEYALFSGMGTMRGTLVVED